MYLAALLAVAGFTVAYWVVVTLYNKRRNAKNAEALGCKPPARKHHRLPLGWDHVRRMMKADKDQILPNEILLMSKEMGKSTWIQNVMGTDLMVTNEPTNLKAMLATQFSDFELGPTRRGNFFPLLGNGIFTADGKAW